MHRDKAKEELIKVQKRLDQPAPPLGQGRHRASPGSACLYKAEEDRR